MVEGGEGTVGNNNDWLSRTALRKGFNEVTQEGAKYLEAAVEFGTVSTQHEYSTHSTRAGVIKQTECFPDNR